jgi:ribosome production factor 2
MAELGIIKLDSIEALVASAEIPFNAQPFLVFQGDLWESDEQIKKLRNLINDFFLMNNRLKGAEIDALLRVVVCWSVTDDRRLHLNVFEVTVEGGAAVLSEEGKLVIEELGPNAIFALRRLSFADEETFKKATYVPKPKKKKQNKNIKYDNLGNKRGKLYVDHQNLNGLPFKRRKLIKKGEKREGDILGHPKNEDEFGQ